MLRQGYGSIVVMTSMSGTIGHPNMTLYCTTKGALTNITRSLALELAEKIFERTGGLPHLLQLYGSVLINLLNNEGKKRKHASMSDFDAVEETVLEKGGNYFNYIVKNAPQAAREILMGLSRGGQVQLRDIKPKTRRWLAHRCLITDDGQLTIPVLARWIREEWE